MATALRYVTVFSHYTKSTSFYDTEFIFSPRIRRFLPQHYKKSWIIHRRLQTIESGDPRLTVMAPVTPGTVDRRHLYDTRLTASSGNVCDNHFNNQTNQGARIGLLVLREITPCAAGMLRGPCRR